MKLWENIFAAGYDHFLAPTEKAGLAEHREHLLQAATGRVLEIGGGTGANLPYYRNGVSELVITEPSDPMLRHLERKLPGYPIPIRLLRAPAERLPFETDSFDTVVSTLVLCTVQDARAALAEVRRVLKSQGRLLFLEHVRSDDPTLARWQDRLRRPWSWFGCGCQCNRPTADNIRAAGFSLADLQHHKLAKAPPLVCPLIVGAAARM
jgi:ubiquinone/menaquinone biosynthesis C-methylase UbiE